MVKLLVAVAIVWVLLMPPLFTGGDCTREFDAESQRLEADRAAIQTLSGAREYWAKRGVESRFLTVEQCRRARDRNIQGCGPGPMLVAQVPVKNIICRVYRDQNVTVQLHYTEKESLSRMQVDMAPFRTLPLPGSDVQVHWAR